MAKLSVLIGGDDRELQAALRRAQSGMRRFGKELRAGINTTAKYTAAIVAAGAAIATHLVKQQLEAIDVTSKMSRVVGLTTQEWIAYSHAATLAGVDTGTFESSMTALIKRIGEARSGTGPLITFMQKYDETLLRTLKSQDSNAGALRLVADAIKDAATEADAAAIANAAFSRQGVKMVEIFRDQGAAALASATTEVKALGLAFNELDARQVEAANDAMTRARAVVTGFATQLTIQLAPILTKIADEFTRGATEGERMGNLSTGVFDRMIDAAAFTADAVDGIRRVFTIAADGLVIVSAKAEAAVKRMARLQLQFANISTLGLSDAISNQIDVLTEDIKFAERVVIEAGKNIQATLGAPPRSEGLRQFIEDAQEAAKARADLAEAGTGDGDGSSGGEPGDGTGDEALQKRLEQLRNQFRSEDELQFQRRDAQLEQIKEFEELKAITEEEAALLREEAEQAHWDRIGEIRTQASADAIDLEKAKNAALRQAQQTFFNNIIGLTNTQSKKLFEFGKLAAIGQASYKGGLAVMDAFEAGMSVGGPFAPAIAVAYASAAALNAANLINNIRSQQFGGSGGTPTAPTQGASGISPHGAGGGTIGGGGGGLTTIVNLQGEFFSREQLRNLLEQINEGTSDGGRIVIA